MTLKVTSLHHNNRQKERNGGDDELRLIFKNIFQFIVSNPLGTEISIAEEQAKGKGAGQ